MVFEPSEYRAIPPTDFLSWLFDGVVDPEKDILIDAVDDRNRLNTRQAVSLVRRIIAGLRAAGLRPGDAVCVHVFNHVSVRENYLQTWLNYCQVLYPIIYFAIIGAGGIFVGSNPAYKASEMSHLLTITRPTFIVVEDNLLADILPSLQGVISPSCTFIFSADAEPIVVEGYRWWSSLLCHGEQDWIRFEDARRAKSTIATYLSTSGTTGLPKVAATSHYALVAAGVSMQHSNSEYFQVSQLICLPLFHAFGASFVQISAFRHGTRTYIMRRFDSEVFTSMVDRYNITDIAAVPALLANIVKQKISPLVIGSLRRVWCAGAPLSSALRDAMYGLLHEEAIISQVWGLTEFGRITSSGWDTKDRSGSVGSLLSNVEARVVDEQGSEISDQGVHGELQVRGPSLMNGYFNRAADTAKAFDGDWLRTGDLGHIKQGNVYISGRLKVLLDQELIKVRGWQVSPDEIEDVLLTHPMIADAAVVGVHIGGRQSEDEYPRAYVVSIDNNPSGTDERKLIKFVANKLASFKALRGGVVFVERIPRNSSGKILRQSLVERATIEVVANSKDAEV
ncbi:acetyl-CoA synthetase-like protein [Aureobasidium subglaciale]|nr:acetyl-CoA synthetase-like protein [Aureobasidium subglaciale]